MSVTHITQACVKAEFAKNTQPAHAFRLRECHLLSIMHKELKLCMMNIHVRVTSRISHGSLSDCLLKLLQARYIAVLMDGVHRNRHCLSCSLLYKAYKAYKGTCEEDADEEAPANIVKDLIPHASATFIAALCHVQDRVPPHHL